jgi:hypothetical protein
LDWLGVAGLWLGALLLAIKSANVPLMTGAPTFLAAGFWNYVPLALITIALAIFLFRQVRPEALTQTAPQQRPEDEPPPFNEKRVGLSNALIEVSRARASARDAYGNRRPNLQPTISTMESALATVRRTFDIETPPPTGHGRTDLKLWLDYFDVVWPFIRSGNYEEAKKRATKFVGDRQAD